MLAPQRAASLQPEVPVLQGASSGERHGGSSLPWLFEQVRDFSLLAKVAGTAAWSKCSFGSAPARVFVPAQGTPGGS